MSALSGGDGKRLFRDDFMAALSMALVTIPLALGIAIAADAPILAGVWAAILGGIAATGLRSSHLAINGPATGLIVVVLAGVHGLGDGDLMEGFRAVLAATVVAGGFIIAAGLLGLGKLADTFPKHVVQGLLAAIGLMILGRQLHVALGAEVFGTTPFEILLDIPNALYRLNPLIALIGFLSFGILVFHPQIPNRWVQAVPATIWVMLLAFGFTWGFDLMQARDFSILGEVYKIAPKEQMVVLPEIGDILIYPNFAHWKSLDFWLLSLTIAVIIFIETLMSGKIVDSIDPQKRHTNLNRELLAVGACNLLGGSVGALPIITAIPLYNGAQTKLSNLYHGLLLLVLVGVFSYFRVAIPLAALAALLVYTGYKFAAPRIIPDSYRKGDDQLMMLLATLITALNFGLLAGIAAGLLVALSIHIAKSNLELQVFFASLARPKFDISRQSTGEYYIRPEGVLNFVNILWLKSILHDAKNEKHIILDLSNTRLIDYTILEYLGEEAEKLDIPGVFFDVIGLDTHASSSRHPYAMRILPEDQKPLLSKRQEALRDISSEYEGEYFPEIRWDVNNLRDFLFFRTRKIDYRLNSAKGIYGLFFEWESCDIVFAEGSAVFANKERHTSVILLSLPFNAPIFVLERETMLDRLSMKQDINFIEFREFSDKFLLQGTDREAIGEFFTPELIAFLEKNEAYHIESNGTTLLLFRQMMFANATDMARLHQFANTLSNLLVGYLKKQTLNLKL